MKTIMSKVMIILLMLNLIAPFSAFAAENKVIYNCGEKVRLTVDLYESNGKIYVHENDLDRLNLYYDSNVISNSEDTTIMELYPGSSIVIVNGTSITYPKATVQNGDYIYVCLDLIAMFFSEQYDITDTTINLWISDSNTDFIRGFISLPSGNVAPAGGIEVEVFAAEVPKGVSTGGNGNTSTSVYYSEIGSPGYKDGEEKPMYDTESNKSNNFLEYNRIVTNTVIIPEGESQVEYTMSAYGDDLYKCIIGYYTEFNNRTYYDKQTYIGNEQLYNFEITEAKTSVSGIVSIPEVAESDVGFRVIAHGGKYDFAYDGVILQGETTSTYSIEVDKNETYYIEVIFLDGEYLRTTSDEKVLVESASVDGIDIVAEASNKYIANISLPSEYTFDGNSFDATVYLQLASTPYYILDVKTVSFDENVRNTSVELFNDMNRKKVICYYVLSGEYNGLFQFGHYSEDGTSFDIDNAEVLTETDTAIDIELLKSKEININFTLPDDEVAEEDIRISATPTFIQPPISSGMGVVTSPTVKEDDDSNDVGYITGDNETIVDYPTSGEGIIEGDPTIYKGDVITYKPNTGDDKISILSVESLSSGGSSAGGSPGGGGGSSIAPPVSLAPPTIKKGESTGEETIEIPDEEGYKYIVGMNVSGGNSKYYNKIYYNALATTSLGKRASIVTNVTDNIDVELIKQYYISGNINAVGFEDSHNRITVASQTSDTIIKDIYDCDFSIYSEIYGVGNYGLYVPAEFEKYILRLNSFANGRTIYYKADECTDCLKDAEVLTINSNKDNIDFSYNGYNPPTPIIINVSSIVANNCNIKLTNISDFDTDVIDVYIGFYGKNGVMTNLLRETAGIVEANSTIELPIKIPSGYNTDAEKIKVMAWHKMKPMANAVEMTNSYVDESKIASAFMIEGSTTIYQHGEENFIDLPPIIYDGLLYVPIRTLAETLDWRALWDAGTSELTLKSDDGNRIVLVENEFEATVNDETISLINAPIVIDGSMMLPFASIASYMGYECVQNDEIGTVAVYDSIDWKVKYAVESYLMPIELRDVLVTEKLTRLELAALIVNMYERVLGKELDITQKPFVDCDDENVLKACSLGIISGKYNNMFEPDSLLTRAEYSKVMFSLFNLIGLDVLPENEYTSDFSDISSEHWASSYVYGLNEIGIFNGIYDGQFKPETNITIKEALAIAGNGYMKLSQSEFPDVSPSNPYKLAITNVCNRRIMLGYEDGTFMPENGITRSEFSAFMARMDGEDIRQSQSFSCSDVPNDHWASGCIEYCINKGIMQLENNEFRPDFYITIAETIDALMNYLGYAPSLDIQEKLMEAKEIGLLNNIKEEYILTAHCLRGMMAQLIENTLDIDMNDL